ncbi:MAG: hypothetical protein PHQ23_06805 [Candidatus Wallbacteria bacterium]|nr:hypothetical protein [Candidatus Wallbacteria bacterium]
MRGALKGFSALEAALGITGVALLSLVLFFFVTTGIDMVSEIRARAAALSGGRMIVSRFLSELEGRFVHGSLQFKLGTAEITFLADINEDGANETVEYYLASGKLYKRVGIEHVLLHPRASGTEFFGDASCVRIQLCLSDNQGTPIFRARAGVRPE